MEGVKRLNRALIAPSKGEQGGDHDNHGGEDSLRSERRGVPLGRRGLRVVEQAEGWEARVGRTQRRYGEVQRVLSQANGGNDGRERGVRTELLRRRRCLVRRGQARHRGGVRRHGFWYASKACLFSLFLYPVYELERADLLSLFFPTSPHPLKSRLSLLGRHPGGRGAAQRAPRGQGRRPDQALWDRPR